MGNKKFSTRHSSASGWLTVKFPNMKHHFEIIMSIDNSHKLVRSKQLILIRLYRCQMERNFHTGIPTSTREFQLPFHSQMYPAYWILTCFHFRGKPVRNTLGRAHFSSKLFPTSFRFISLAGRVFPRFHPSAKR